MICQKNWGRSSLLKEESGPFVVIGHNFALLVFPEKTAMINIFLLALAVFGLLYKVLTAGKRAKKLPPGENTRVSILWSDM
jgi:hypothetical protein